MNSQYKNIKGLGLGIVCFDAAELLQGIISPLRDIFDYVVIALQKVSYHGDKISLEDYTHCYKLKDQGLVDEIIEIELDASKEARQQETDKRNLLTQHIQDNNCSHALIIDSDEYWPRESVIKALDYIDKNDIEISYARYVNYYHDFEHYLVYPFKEQYVPFVTKVAYRNKFNTTDFDKPSDPTRRYVRPFDPSKSQYGVDANGETVLSKKHFLVDYSVFPWNELKMHHLSWIRANIRKKLNNWSSKKLFSGYVDMIDKCVDRFECFDYDSKSNAKLIFNTPNNEVEIEKFPKQYINFDYDIQNALEPQYEKKKWAIVVLGCLDPIYIPLEAAIRQTYLETAKSLGVDVYFLLGGEIEKVDKANNYIYVRTSDGLDNIAVKNLEGMRVLYESEQYDYILRTNLSTWVNVELLDKFLGLKNNEEICYCGEMFSAFWMQWYLYPGGNAMIFTKAMVERIVTQWALNKEHYIKTFRDGCISDDVATWSIEIERCLRLGIDHTKRIKSLGLLAYESPNSLSCYIIKNFPPDSFANPFIQVKSVDPTCEEETLRQLDANKMLCIDEHYKDIFKTQADKDALIGKMHIDENCYFYPFSKDDWFAGEIDKFERRSNKMSKQDCVNNMKDKAVLYIKS